jgi:hypothetical protein
VKFKEIGAGQYEATPRQLCLEKYVPWPTAIFSQPLGLEFFMHEALLEGIDTFCGYVYKTRTGETLRIETRWTQITVPDDEESSREATEYDDGGYDEYEDGETESKAMESKAMESKDEDDDIPF